MNKITMSLCLIGFVAVSVSGTEPKVITLGENEKAGEVLVLSGAKLVKLTADQKSIKGLEKLADDSISPVVYDDDAGNSGGAIGFIGSTKIAFVTNLTIHALLKITDKEASAILDNTTPIPYTAFVQKYGKNPAIPYPTSPIQMSPTMSSLLLKDKTSNIILCKFLGQLYAIELVEKSANKLSVQIMVHPIK